MKVEILRLGITSYFSLALVFLNLLFNFCEDQGGNFWEWNSHHILLRVGLSLQIVSFLLQLTWRDPLAVLGLKIWPLCWKTEIPIEIVWNCFKLLQLHDRMDTDIRVLKVTPKCSRAVPNFGATSEMTEWPSTSNQIRFSFKKEGGFFFLFFFFCVFFPFSKGYKNCCRYFD